MADAELNWPKKGDKLFVGALPDWQHNACIGYLGDSVSNWDLYVEGYRKAADAIVGHLMEDRSELDFMVFPVVYLYRHHVEIALKTIIMLARRLNDEEGGVPTGHKLLDLWRMARTLLEREWPKNDTVPLDAVESCIRELVEFDPGSDAFRYPVGKDKSKHLEGLTHVNVRHLAEVAGRMSDFLLSCIVGLWETVDQREEYLSDMRSMYGPGEW